MEEVKRIGFFRSVAEVFGTIFGNGAAAEIEDNTSFQNSNYFLKESHEVKEILRGALEKIEGFEKKYKTPAKAGVASKKASKETVKVKAEAEIEKVPQKDEGREIGD